MMNFDEKHRTRIPRNKYELAECREGDLVKVRLDHDMEFEFMVYVNNRGYDMFISQNKKDPEKINCWFSERKYFQFDWNNGVIFDSFQGNFSSLSQAFSEYKRFSQLLHENNLWRQKNDSK